MNVTIDSVSDVSKISSRDVVESTPELQIVLMCRNRVQGALRAVEAIMGQTTLGFSFYVSDNSTNSSVSDAIVDRFPLIELKKRGGDLKQFEHMTSIITESSSDYLLITHDDDFLFENFVAVARASLPKSQDVSVLLNRVLAYEWLSFKAPSVGVTRTFFKPRISQSFRAYNQESVLRDYLLGCFCNYFYSVSMTVFNVKLAKKSTESMVNSGNLADACFLIKMCSLGKVIINDTPVGAYEMSADSVSHSLSLRDSKMFLRFLYLEGHRGLLPRELKFFKLRTRFFFARNVGTLFSYRMKLFLSFLIFSLSPFSARVILGYIRRKAGCFVGRILVNFKNL